MAGERRTFALGEITVNHDGKRKPVKESERRPGPYPYYGASGIVDYVDDYLFDGDYLLIAEDGENLRTRQTPLAFMARGKFWVNNHTHIVTGNEKVDTRFLMYALQGMDISGYLTGAVMPKLTQGNLNKIDVDCPSLPKQRAIARILGTLDDKIELNRRMNLTLEAMARALFKSWFVDFDGVPPENMQESELGMIPRGWRVASFEEHVDAVRGLSYNGAGLTEAGAGMPMHNLNSVLEFGGYKYAGIKYYSGDYKERHLAVAGDIIIANTEQGHKHRLIGFPAIVPRNYPISLFSHHLYRVRIKIDSPITREWLYHCLMAPAIREQIIGCANGSTVNMLKPDGLKTPRFAFPPHELCEKFDAIAAPFRLKAEANVEQVETLVALRDTLLPRLISGQIELPSTLQRNLHEDAIAST